jgi:hypothetical protein
MLTRRSGPTKKFCALPQKHPQKKSTTKPPKIDESRGRTKKTDVQETIKKNASKTENKDEQEELYQAVQSLIATGMSTKMIEEYFIGGKTENKTRIVGLKLGRGRGRGRGSGIGKDRNMGKGT